MKCSLQCNINLDCDLLTYIGNECKLYFKNAFDHLIVATEPLLHVKIKGHAMLISYWPFNGELIDVVRGKNMIIRKSASFSEDKNGKISSALDLNVGYVQAPEGVYFEGDFTITVWVFLRSVLYWARILDFGNGDSSDNIELSFSDANTVRFRIYEKSTPFICTTTKPMNLDQWYFTSVVLEGTLMKLYFDGQFQSCPQKSFKPRKIIRKDNYLGKSEWINGGNGVNGKIDELKIFKRALDEKEIWKEMNN